MISVIVPVYNAENFLSRCLDSIIGQSYDDLELVLVDDGSTDKSLDICKSYAEKDNRILVYHKENGGQTSARRHGFYQSKGEWIYFVDADDFIPKLALEILVKLAEYNKLDIVEGGAITYYEDFSVKCKDIFEEGVFERLEYLHRMFLDKTHQATHACLFKRSLFTEEAFDISEDVKLGEDLYIHLCLAVQACRIGVYKNIVYNYVMNKTSITNRYIYTSLRPVEWQIESIRKVLNRHQLFDDFKMIFYQRSIPNLAVACLNNKRLLSDDYNKEFAKEAFPYITSIYKRALCYMLIHPSIYPIYNLGNKIRRFFKS